MTTSLALLLARVGAPVTFATEGRIPIGDLAVEVAGVGRLGLPITQATARKLSGVARPSPFGLGEETLFDPAVRRSWEIPPHEVRVRGRGWDAALAAYLRQAQVELGLPPDAILEPAFDKLLIYEKGQFFKAHQDSERDDDMVASLVVVLPSEYRGGELVVEHRGETRTFARPTSRGREASLAVFYADCRHEVRPVTSGARVTLTYRLRLRGDRLSRTDGSAPDLASALEASVREHFSRPLTDRFSRAMRSPAERLVVLLDHEYSQRSLSWGRLKGADRARVDLLAAVAERLDCERFLALGETHETWLCGRDEPYYGGRRRRFGRDSWRDADDDDDRADRGPTSHPSARDYELLELEAFEIHLDHWVDAAGKRSQAVEVPIEDHELVVPTPSREIEPFRVEHEGYQGNYGNTVDRWYRRAALVMWPRKNTFVLRAKAAPGWAVDQLLAIPPDDTTELESKVAALLPSWRGSAGQPVSSRFAARVMKVATRIERPSMACDWLVPVGWRGLEGIGARRDLVQLVDRHGLEWGQGLLTRWRGGSFYGIREDAVAMLPMCELLAGSGSVPARALAVWWVTRELDAAIQTYLLGRPRSSTWLELDDESPAPRSLAGIFAAAVAVGEVELVSAALQRILGEPRLASLPFLVGLLRACLVGSEALRGHTVGSVLQGACVERLGGIVGRPSRAPDDWSLEVSLGCSCEDCKMLDRFLRSDLTALDLPLAKDRRQHLHSQIDLTRLPVLHATRREGRPYTLQLRKDRDLFRREAEHRARAETILQELLAPPKAAKSGRSRSAEKPERQAVTRGRRR